MKNTRGKNFKELYFAFRILLPSVKNTINLTVAMDVQNETTLPPDKAFLSKYIIYNPKNDQKCQYFFKTYCLRPN